MPLIFVCNKHSMASVLLLDQTFTFSSQTANATPSSTPLPPLPEAVNNDVDMGTSELSHKPFK